MDLVIYVSLGLLIASLELARRYRHARVDAFSLFNGYYFIFFVFVPINIIFFGEQVVRQKYAFETFGGGNVFTALTLFCTYILFCFGYSIKPKIKRIGHQRWYGLGDSTKVAVVILFLGLISISAHIVRLGGVSEVIINTQALRAETVIQSKYLWVNFFNSFLADSFVLLCVVVIGKRVAGGRVSRKYYLALLLTFLAFVYYALSTGGR